MYHALDRVSRSIRGVVLYCVVFMFLAVLAVPAVPGSSPCDGTVSIPTGLQDLLAAHCTARLATFGDDQDPGTCFEFGKSLDKLGIYEGTTWLGEPITLLVVHVADAGLQGDPDFAASGTEGFAVYGTLAGPLGSIPVGGIAFSNFPGGSQHVFMITRTLTTGELEVFSNATMIRAGVAVVDTATAAVSPLAELGSAATVLANAENLSVLYASDGNEIDVDCVKLAYARHNIATDAARGTYKACMVTKAVEFAACMGFCAATAFVPGPWTPFLVTGCSLTCLVYEASEMVGCEATYYYATKAADETLRLDLAACGVTFFYL
jgi:hypothetical protein